MPLVTVNFGPPPPREISKFLHQIEIPGEKEGNRPNKTEIQQIRSSLGKCSALSPAQVSLLLPKASGCSCLDGRAQGQAQLRADVGFSLEVADLHKRMAKHHRPPNCLADAKFSKDYKVALKFLDMLGVLTFFCPLIEMMAIISIYI